MSTPEMENVTAPSLLRRAYRLAKFAFEASTTHGGWKLVSEEHHKARLEVCDPCPERRGKTCLACGCYLPAAAAMDIKECESKLEKRNKWEETDRKFQ